MTMKDDPVIAEIRRIRHEMSDKFGHDPKRLIKFLQEQDKVTFRASRLFPLLSTEE